MSASYALKRWIKQRRHPAADFLYRFTTGARQWSCPTVPWLHAGLYGARLAFLGAVSTAVRTLWTTPLFKSRLAGAAPGLFLFGGMPLVLGPVESVWQELPRFRTDDHQWPLWRRDADAGRGI